MLPDAATERAVRGEWARLAEAGLPSLAAHTAPSNRPHVTVAVRDGVDPRDCEPLVSLLPTRLELGGVLLFGGSGRFVLVRQVVMTAALLDIHRAVAAAVGPAGERHANTAPDRWTPHVTLGRRLDASQVSVALQILDPSPVVGALEGLRVWDAAAKVVTTLR